MIGKEQRRPPMSKRQRKMGSREGTDIPEHLYPGAVLSLYTPHLILRAR